MGKMGIHNKVTAERFWAMKRALNDGRSVKEVAKQFGVSDTTARRVRRHTNYRNYYYESSKHKPISIIAEKSKLEYEDFPPKEIFSSRKPLMNKRAISDKLDRESDKTANLVGFILLGAIAVIAIVAIACIFRPNK